MRSKPRKSKFGIWLSNKCSKKRRKKDFRVKPKVNKCLICRTGKVRHHHYYCDRCYEKHILPKYKKQNGKDDPQEF